GENRFKKVFRHTRTQGGTPQTVRKSLHLSPHKETAEPKRRRKLNLYEEAEESGESKCASPTSLEQEDEPQNEEEQKDEEMKDGEEREKETSGSTHATIQ
ncbi:hypothetical protein KI387_024857, partial [Taxus chinensis]